MPAAMFHDRTTAVRGRWVGSREKYLWAQDAGPEPKWVTTKPIVQVSRML